MGPVAQLGLWPTAGGCREVRSPPASRRPARQRISRQHGQGCDYVRGCTKTRSAFSTQDFVVGIHDGQHSQSAPNHPAQPSHTARFAQVRCRLHAGFTLAASVSL